MTRGRTALEMALALAAEDISTFPCSGSNKRPCTRHGFHDAVRDPAAVRDLWRRYPGELVGVPTGRANGFDVLDFDPRHGGGAWWAEHRERIPRTRAHRTRSGGLHLLFRHREGVRNSESKLGHGVDTRGAGGYVIWWPGAGLPVLSDAPLAEWPTWVLEQLLPPPAPPRAAPAAAFRPRNATAAERMLGRVLYHLEAAPAGQRHYRLRAAACTIGGLLDAAGIGEAEATRVLLDAVKRAGGAEVSDRNALGTIAWGLARGRQSPFEIGGDRA